MYSSFVCFSPKRDSSWPSSIAEADVLVVLICTDDVALLHRRILKDSITSAAEDEDRGHTLLCSY